MSELVVKPSVMNRCVSSEQGIAKKLNNLSGEITSIQRSLSFNIRSRAKIDSQLTALAKVSQKNSQNSGQLAKVLSEAVGIYNSAENTVQGNIKTSTAKKGSSKNNSSKPNNSNGDWKISASVIGAFYDKNNPKAMDKQISDTIDDLEKELNKNLSKKQRKALEKLLKDLIGENKYDAAMAVLDILRGKATWNTYEKALKAIATEILGSSPYTDAIMLTFKNAKKYMKMNEELEDALFDAALKHDFGAIGRLLLKGLVKNLGGGVVDVGCQLIDSQLEISKYVQIMKDLTGIDVGKYFNGATSAVNSFWDKLFG